MINKVFFWSNVGKCQQSKSDFSFNYWVSQSVFTIRIKVTATVYTTIIPNLKITQQTSENIPIHTHATTLGLN